MGREGNVEEGVRDAVDVAVGEGEAVQDGEGALREETMFTVFLDEIAVTIPIFLTVKAAGLR